MNIVLMLDLKGSVLPGPRADIAEMAIIAALDVIQQEAFSLCAGQSLGE